MSCHYLEAGADRMIVACALQHALEGNEVTVVADDMDVLILLIYHWKDNMADICFHSELKKKRFIFMEHLCDLVNKVGKTITSYLLFVHAWSGCDTTSATFGHGKTSLLKKIKESEELQQISVFMSDPHMTAEQIDKAGIRAFVIMFGDKKEDSLNSSKFMEIFTSSKSLGPQKLPPTERAAYCHNLQTMT